MNSAIALLMLGGCLINQAVYDQQHKRIANRGDLDGDLWTESEGDCDDRNASVNPGESEVWYDGIDQDCDGNDVDRDGDGSPGIDAGGPDCDDANEAVHPGAAEVPYDGVDNDCDPSSLDDDLDQDGFDGASDCDDTDPSAYPGGLDLPGDAIDGDCSGMPLSYSAHRALTNCGGLDARDATWDATDTWIAMTFRDTSLDPVKWIAAELADGSSGSASAVVRDAGYSYHSPKWHRADSTVAYGRYDENLQSYDARSIPWPTGQESSMGSGSDRWTWVGVAGEYAFVDTSGVGPGRPLIHVDRGGTETEIATDAYTGTSIGPMGCDGDWVVYQSWDASGVGIRARNIDSGQMKDLARDDNTGRFYQWAAALSKDCRTVGVVVDESRTGQQRKELVVLDLPSAGETILVSNVLPGAGGGDSYNTRISIDAWGSQVAYMGWDGSGEEQIFVVPVAAGAPIQISTFAANELLSVRSPVLANTGSSIAFEAMDRSKSQWCSDVWVLDAQN